LATAEYKLVWSDEFDGNALNTKNWMYEVDCIGGGNNELQCYTSRQENVYVRNGSLHLRAIPEAYKNRQYTSGRLNSRPAGSWKYGKFEIRAKLPKGDYIWPALWMLSRDKAYGEWAASGEIDIMEYRGQNNFEVSSTLHFGGQQPNNANKGSGMIKYPFDFTTDFHVFSCIWEKDQIQFLVDGKVHFTQSLVRSFYSGRGANPYTDIRQPFDKPFFFLFNVAVGGGFFGANSHALTVEQAKKWPNPEMQVDWVRVYQDNGVIVNPVPVPSSSKAQTSAKPTTSQQAPQTLPTPKPSTSQQQTPKPTTSQQAPATTAKPSQTSDDACKGKCGNEGCCNDQRLGVVCYSTNTHACATDSNGKHSLCGKGLGTCSGVCFDAIHYKCVGGTIRQN